MSIDLFVTAAPVVVAAGAVLLLLGGLWFDRAVLAPTALGVLATAGVLLAISGTGETFCVDSACSYAADQTTVLLQWLILAGAAAVVLMAAAFVPAARISGPEFYGLMLAATSGALVVPAAGDLATLLIALETVSLPTYALIGLRRDDAGAGEAALKAFLVSVAATAVSLYGLALLYLSTGTVFLSELPDAVSGEQPPLVAVAVVLLFALPVFKTAAVPLHGWAPDVYSGAPLPVTAFLAVVSKTAGIAAVLLLARTFLPLADVWAVALGVAAGATLALGVLAALRQDVAGRFLGWSSVAQAGFLLAPLGAVAGEPDRFDSAESAVLAYLVTYAAMTVAVFAAVLAAAGTRSVLRRSDLVGLITRAPVATGVLAVGLVSLAGLPPAMLGLFAKVRVIAEPVGAGSVVLAVLLALAVLVGVAAYLRWLIPALQAGSGRVSVPIGVSAAGVIAAVVLVVGSVAPEWVLGLG